MSIEPLQKLIGNLERQPHWQTRRQLYQIVQYWPKAVGHLVARQTRPVSIQRQILYVNVSTAAWAQTLTFERQRILTQLNERLTCPLSDIKFSAAQWAQSRPRRPSPTSELLRQHPSYVPTPKGNAAQNAVPKHTRQVPHSATPRQQQPHDAQSAFASWASTVRSSHQHQVLCPECQCHCPSGELTRWQMCALCAAKQWQIRQPFG